MGSYGHRVSQGNWDMYPSTKAGSIKDSSTKAG